MGWREKLGFRSSSPAPPSPAPRPAYFALATNKALDPRRIDAQRVSYQSLHPYGKFNEPPTDAKDLEKLEVYHDVIWRCIKLKSGDAASVKLCLFQGTPRDPEDEITDHPLLELLDRPAPDVTSSEWWQNNYADLDSTGDLFNFEYKGTGPAPISFARLRPSEVTPEPDRSGRRTIGSYTWETKEGLGTFGTFGAGSHTIPWDRMFHVKQRNVYTSLRGMGTLGRLRVLADMHNVMWEWNWTRYAHGIPTEYIVFFKGQLTPDERIEVEGQLRSKFTGPKGDNFLLLEATADGEAQWEVKEFPRPSETELAFLQSEKGIVYAIGRAFGVPPNKLMDFEQSTRIANADAMERVYWEDTITELHSLMLDTMNNRYLPLWFPGEKLFLKYDYSTVRALQKSAKEQADIHAIYVTNGVMSRNEVRESIGMERVDEPLMDEYLQNGRPLGSSPLEGLLGAGEQEPGSSESRPPVPKKEEEQEEEGKRAAVAKVVSLHRQKQGDSFIQEPLLDLSEEQETFRRLVHAKLRIMVERAGKQHLRLSGIAGSFNVKDPRVLEFIEHMEVRLSQDIVLNTNEMVRAAIADGYEEGLGVVEMRDAIQGAFVERRSTGQLDRIARTEMHQAQEGGSYEAALQNGLEMKRWLTAKDSRVRGLDPDDDADHDAIEEAGAIPMEAPFVDPRSGARMQFPGDRSGAVSGADTINCRCTWVSDFTHLDEEKRAKGVSAEGHWFSKQDRREAMELDFRRTVKRFLLGMERRALAKYDAQTEPADGGVVARGGI